MYQTEPVDLSSIFDTRDVLSRIEYLADTVDDENADEYDRMTALVSELSDYFDGIADGITIIPDHQFEDYARELADDLGLISGEAQWPAAYIDWEAAAKALQMDYSAFEFEGTTYWGRE